MGEPVTPPPPGKADKLLIDSLDGDITRREVDTFVAYVAAIPVPTNQYPNGSHNYLSDGTGGTILEAINLLYEVTGEIPALAAARRGVLDLAIKWSDTWLVNRNDLPMGEKRVMWTGQVDPVWPPNPPPSKYAASEVGETVGILAFTAFNILRTPALADQKVPDGDPNHYGATYGARAKTYVSMLDAGMDKFFDAYFIDRTTASIRHPQNQPGYEAYGANNVNAWNRMMMFLHAWQTLGQIHELLGDDPPRASLYKKITVNMVDEFVKNALPYTAKDGTAVYDWGYGNYGDWKGSLRGEDTGIHAQYDVWGLTRAYRAGYTTATPQQMKTYADTVVHALMVSPGMYGAKINGGAAKYNYLPPGFMYLAPYNPEIYKTAAMAGISSGRQQTSAAVTVSILWAKQQLARAH